MKNKRPAKMTRRGVLKMGAGLSLGGVLGTSESAQAAADVKPNVYEALGVRPFINACGTVTWMGGSVMPPEVVAAWAEASKHFVNLYDLQDKVGERIAKLLGVEAALVTTGASGALLLGTAAIVTGGDRTRTVRLPDTAGLKNEVILQKAHRSTYDIQFTTAGVKMIEVETAADVKKAVNPRTALMFFMNYEEPLGKIKKADWCDLARGFKIPTLIDMAADIPPRDRIAEYIKMGFDLLAISGGKAMRGPNDTGLLLGRKNVIAAAKLNTNPIGGTIGRMMKVSKEDMVAAAVAVERFVNSDEKAMTAEYERRIGVIEDAVKDISTVKSERIVPAIANHVPHVIFTWDEKKFNLTPAQVKKQLLDGEPSIMIERLPSTGDQGVLFCVSTLQEGEDKLVGSRFAGILREALKKVAR